MFIGSYIESLQRGLINTSFCIDGNDTESELFFDKLVEDTKQISSKRGRMFFLGNGASSAFSNHMALDWSKNGKIISVSPSDSSLLTALANDYSYKDCFSEFLKINRLSENDIVISTSSSGNSDNIISALKLCNDIGVTTVAFSGLNEKNISISLSNYSIYVPMKTYGMVECAHQIFHHIWLDKFMGVEEWNKIESQNMNIKNYKL